MEFGAMNITRMSAALGLALTVATSAYADSGRILTMNCPCNEGSGGNIYFRVSETSGVTFVIAADAKGAEQLRQLLFFAADKKWDVTVDRGALLANNLFAVDRMYVNRP
jgi:hypothetical protein